MIGASTYRLNLIKKYYLGIKVRENDGIWGKHWYDSVYKSDGFLSKKSSNNVNIRKYEDIYEEALCYYKKIYNFAK